MDRTFLYSDFWFDPQVDQASPAEKLAMLWLVTNPAIDECGVLQRNDTRFQRETKLKPAVLDHVLMDWRRNVLEFGDRIWLRKFVRYQYGHGALLANNKFSVKIINAISRHPLPIQQAMLEEYPELARISPKWVVSYQIVKYILESGLLNKSPSQVQDPHPDVQDPHPDVQDPHPKTPHLTPSANPGWGSGVQDPPTQGTHTQGTSGEEREEGSPGPTLDQVLARASMINVPEDLARRFYHHYAGLGWEYRGSRILHWEQWLKKWACDPRPAGPQTHRDLDGLKAQLQCAQTPAERTKLLAQINGLEK